MSSIFNYDILSNFRYTDIFFYHNLDQRLELGGKIDHTSSDIISNLLKMGEKQYSVNLHRKPKFRIMKFHTDPNMALKMANAEESDGIDDIDDLFDTIKYNS